MNNVFISGSLGTGQSVCTETIFNTGGRRKIGTKTWRHCKERTGKIYLLKFLDTVLKASALCRLISLPKRFSNIYSYTYTAVSEMVVGKKA